MVKKGISKERHYVASQIAISRRVQWYKLALRGRQETTVEGGGNRSGGGAGGVLTMA